MNTTLSGLENLEEFVADLAELVADPELWDRFTRAVREAADHERNGEDTA